MTKFKATATALLSMLVLCMAATSATAALPVSISNEFIRVIVNADETEMGRFGIETTGGDPANPNDGNLPLIYGRPVPWTSYTTIRIDGKDWVFGGKASKRAGMSGNYGKVVSAPTAMGNSIVTSFKLGDLRAVQDLSFARNQMTGYNDTVRIAYTLINEASGPVEVGLRVMLDTMLGRNDGAPLRAGEEAITSDSLFEAGALPDFWQAFDSLTEPSITSQATLKGKDLTVPGRVVFSNWGAFADNLWEVRLVPGRDFTREGEFDLDSAAAMYWEGVSLKPGAQVSFVTYYGLGGIAVAPGNLSIGVAVPAEVLAAAEGQPGTFSAVVYLQNTGKGPALDAKVKIELQKGLQLVSQSDYQRSIGDMKPGALVQLTYQVRTDGATYGPLRFKITAESSNTEANSIERVVDVLSPPRLSLKLLPVSLKAGDDGKALNYYKVGALIKNIGASTSYWNEATMELTGANLLPGDASERQIGHLLPGEEYELAWHISPFKETTAVGVKVKAASSNAKQVSAQMIAPTEPETRSIFLEIGGILEGFIEAKVSTLGLSGVSRVEFDIAWDGDALSALGKKPLAAGALMLLPDGTSPGLKQGTASSKGITGIVCSFLAGGDPRGTLVSVDFKIAAAGKATIRIENVKAWDATGKQLVVINDGLKAIIK